MGRQERACSHPTILGLDSLKLDQPSEQRSYETRITGVHGWGRAQVYNFNEWPADTVHPGGWTGQAL